MKLPTLVDLDRVSQLMHGMDFVPLPGEFKPAIVAIAQQGVLAAVLDDLPVNLGIQLAETLVEHGPKWKQLIDALKELDETLIPINNWFAASKVYYP